MFCHLGAKKSSKVISMSHPFPKNQMRHEANSKDDNDASAC